MDFMIYKYAPPPNPPNLPPGVCSFFPNYCHLLHEPNFFDKTCFSSSDKYGGLGCNAGGLICCRFCEFRQYSKVPCIQSPSIPPYPRFPPASPPCPYSPPEAPPPPSSPPPNNPLIVKIGDKIKNPTESKVNFHMRLDANIESIDTIKIKDKLRKIFKKIPRYLINIHFRPGSLIIDVSIMTNITVVQNTTDIINEYNSTTLGNVLNMTIIEMSPPVIETYTVDPINYKNNGVYIFGALFGAFGGLVIMRVLVLTCKFNNSISIDDTNTKTKKIEISDVSDVSDTKNRRQTLEDINKFMGVDHHRTRLHSWHFENMGNIEA
jgi:hypothetical protein